MGRIFTAIELEMCDLGKSFKGAALVEFALIAALLFFVILGVIDVARYVAVRGVLGAAADEAVTLASTVPGLEDHCSTSSYLTAKRAILERALRLPNVGLLETRRPEGLAYLAEPPVLTIPWEDPRCPNLPPSVFSNSQAVSENEPIVVRLTALVRPSIPWLPLLKASGYAAAFREPTRRLTLPVQLDCRGNPLGSPDFNRDCPCEAGKYWDAGAGKCYCYLPRPATEGVCHCEDPLRIPDASGRTCICNPAPCSDPLKMRDASTCQCVCDSSRGLTEGADGCQCPSKYYRLEHGKCLCNLETRCEGRAVFDAASCSCTCPSDTWWEVWYCPYRGGVWNAATCRCDANCGPDATWREDWQWCMCNDPNRYFDTLSHACRCYSWSTEVAEVDGECVCTNPAKEMANGWCYCKAKQCDNPAQGMNPDSCECACGW